MHKAIVSGRRWGIGLAALAVALLGLGGTPAQANEGPVYQEIKVTYVTSSPSSESCAGSEVWGVAAGKDTPESKWGNYQVCRYASSAVGADFGTDVDPGLQTKANEAVWKAAGSPPTGTFVSRCVYYMPTGPNRMATITYTTKWYEVEVIEHWPNGESFVVDTASGWHDSRPTVRWSPSCASL